MNTYCFDEQSRLLEIAIAIIEDYNISDWSFGGGTALSCAYYQHRMSYDIDIFSTDFSSISNLVSHKEEIANNLSISLEQVQSSPSGVTFILSEEEHQLKLDFLFSEQLSNESYINRDILGQTNISVQTPIEIISKKLKHREILTIRDFVDLAYAQRVDGILTKIKESNIIDLERFIDVLTQFESISSEDFNRELEYLEPNFMNEKSCISNEIFEALTPSSLISIAFNENFEVLAIDNWINEYKEEYESIGEYKIYNDISKESFSTILNKKTKDITYNDIYELPKNRVIELIESL